MADEADDRGKWHYLLGILALIVAILALVEMAGTTASTLASDPMQDNGIITTQMYQDVSVGSALQVYASLPLSSAHMYRYACGGPGSLPYYTPDNDTIRGEIGRNASNPCFHYYYQTPSGVKP